jgi:hypothetical protein
MRELKKRIGYKRASQLAGVSSVQFYRYLGGKVYSLKREVAERAVMALAQVRTEQEGITPDEAYKARMTIRGINANRSRNSD